MLAESFFFLQISDTPTKCY